MYKIRLRSNPILCAILVFLCTIKTVSAQSGQDPIFAAAMEHIEHERWVQAETILELQISLNPDWHRAKIELALVYAKLGKHEQALAILDTVLVLDGLPENVKANLSQMRSQIVEEQSQEIAVLPDSHNKNTEHESLHNFTGYIELAGGFDDNVYFSSGDYFIEGDPYIDGFFFETEDGETLFISPDGYTYDSNGNRLFLTSDVFDIGDPNTGTPFAEYNILMSHKYSSPLGKFQWQNNLSLQTSDNTDEPNFNRQQAKIDSKFRWIIDDKIKVNLDINHRILKRNGVVQVKNSGIQTSLSYFTYYGSWELAAKINQRIYEDASYIRGDFITQFVGYETDIYSVSGKWSKLLLDNRLLLFAKLEYLDSHSKENFDSKGHKTTIAVVHSLNSRWKWSASISNFKTDYDTEGNFDEFNSDRSSSLRGKLTYNFTPDWELFFSAEIAERNSDTFGGVMSEKKLGKFGIKFKF